MFKQLEPLLTETDWEKFDGYTPTFKHPNLTERELRFLLGAAYTRFYMRPSYLANFLKIQNTVVRDWVSRMDRRVNDRHTREEIADIPARWHADTPAWRIRRRLGATGSTLTSMLTAISRYGARVLPDTEQLIAALQGPRRVHPGTADRGVRARVRAARRPRHARSPPPTAASRSTTC